jgi:hypothetical protein
LAGSFPQSWQSSKQVPLCGLTAIEGVKMTINAHDAVPELDVHYAWRMEVCVVFMLVLLACVTGVAKKLWEMELTIHKVKVSTSPDDKAVNLFFVTDNRYCALTECTQYIS